MTGPRRAAVLGRPVAHSLSPALHNAAYRALGLDWTYTSIDCGVDELPGLLASRRDWAGFSCTMPLKQAALTAASEVRSRAATVGAANTLLPGPRGWVADNTDVTGILAALDEAGVDAGSATVLGAGGTARAAVVALVERGLRECTVLVREPARARELARLGSAVGCAVTVQPLDRSAPALAAALIISTLPPGAADVVAGRDWTSGQAVLDVVYDPWPTTLARSAEQAGARTIGGAAMLLHQAAAQVELMTGQPAPLSAMRAALPGPRATPA